MSGRVRGKVALVTGGASGIGRAVARMLALEGAMVVVTDINAAAGAELQGELGEQGLFMIQDAASEADWQHVMETVRGRFGRLDILINNAGILRKGSIEESSLEDWQQLMRVNADSVFLGCKAAVALMKETGGGSIVNMSSITSMAGKDDYVAYGASKGAIAALTRGVASHCRKKKYRIRCNSVHPDGVMTPMSAGQMPPGIDPARFTIDVDPAFRSCLPEDVAAAVLFLASDESRAINGIELRVDSGQFVMSV